MHEDISLNFTRNRVNDLRHNLERIMEKGRPWPQRLGSISPGFLSPILIPPSDFFAYNNTTGVIEEKTPTTTKVGNYEYEDWLGQRLTQDGLIPLSTSDRFNESKNIPKSKGDLHNSPYSTRDHYLIFSDNSTDYFRHGLQVIDNLTPIENPTNGRSNLRLDNFKSTPFENNDPVMFGFEIVIDSVSSPLLNGSINDFLTNYSMVNEIRSKIPVYEDFKQQFIKFFKTTGSVRINPEQVALSKTKTNYANSESQKSIHQRGKVPYMNNYLKKVDGLDNLSESNTSSGRKYITEYRKDVIKLEFTEDVSLSVGTMAHLYKLLYWSRPNGKNLVPENLLRFNCDIIISECRSYNRTRKAVGTGDLEVLKDNLSRYVYSLKECQLFFNNLPHPSTVDLGDPKIYENYSIEFDYKYSTVLFERFLETSDGFGKYVGYDGGSIWKIGNQPRTTGTQSDSSVPKFFTVGGNKLSENGVTKPLIIKSLHPVDKLDTQPSGFTQQENVDSQEVINRSKATGIEAFKNNIKDRAKDSLDKLKKETIKSVEREIVSLVNSRVNLISRTINKIGIGFVGGKGIKPPQNVYKQDQGVIGNALSNVKDRFFYDIRNEVTDFLGGSLGSFLSGANFK